MKGKHKRRARTVSVFMALLMCALMILAIPLAAGAEILVVSNPDPTDRLNMRTKAQAGSPILRKYDSGVEVEVLSTPNSEWAYVRIGTAEGYMQRQFLKPLGSVVSAIPMGIVKVTPPQTSLALRQNETDDSQAVGIYADGSALEVLGVGDSWLHVRMVEDRKTGFMRSAWVAEPDNLMYGVISANDTSLRETPDAKSRSLGVYNTGIEFVVLLSFEKLDGWTRVRIGDTVGFIENSSIARNPEPGSYDNPMKRMMVDNNGAFVNMRKTASTKTSVVSQIESGEWVDILGKVGDWSHVRFGDLAGYVQNRFLKQ